MDYITLKEASSLWSISPRMINYDCSAGRNSGAIKTATILLISKDTDKPVDKRYKINKLRGSESK